MPDLHRHDEFSTFDGYGKAVELAKIAIEKGYKSLSVTNHGNVSGLVEHYVACKDAGIKPIMGVEIYFQPKFDKEKTRYHLCLFAKNLQGYKNLNRIMTRANIKKKYYYPLVDFEDLEEYSEGLICSSACVAGPIAQAIVLKNGKMAEKLTRKFKSIFGDDFYLEIQPYKISQKGMQEKINESIIELGDKLDIKCILTSDSHYGNKEDFDTYLKMHEIAKHKLEDIESTYGERYMPTYKELYQRFIKMHPDYEFMGKGMIKNLHEIEDKIEDGILDKLELVLPDMFENSYQILKTKIKEGLVKKGKWNKEYQARCKEELDVISYHGFEDYFLIVEDYVRWAKENDVKVGPGRGSVCNCLIAYALDITDTDPIYFDLDFRRFLRKDKKKLPDIDLDFETAKRKMVIDYITSKKEYRGKSAQICSYGLYKVDNLINDLCKVCGVYDKNEIFAIKKFIKNNIIDDKFEYELVEKQYECKKFNQDFDDIIKHFSKLYKQVRFIGTHAAGVAIVGDKLLDHVSLITREDKISTAYDLNNLDVVNVVKFDILGLKTMSEIRELEKLTGEYFDYSWLDDEKMYEMFKEGKTDGIFQFEKKAAKSILMEMECDCIEDVIAASALNRPGPLSLGMPQQYAENKKLIKEGGKSKKSKDNIFYEYTKETYGTFVYQEQIMRVCIELGEMSWEDADKTIKFLKGGHLTEKALRIREQEQAHLESEFVKGAKNHGIPSSTAKEIFERILVYAFNKGHAAGYGLISAIQMHYKIYYPLEFWAVKLKYESDLGKSSTYMREAVRAGFLIFLPHVNQKAQVCVRKVEGEKVIQLGYADIKDVGLKGAQCVEAERRKNGKFKNLDDLLDRVPKKNLNKKAIEALENAGATDFNEESYYRRIIKFNSAKY